MKKILLVLSIASLTIHAMDKKDGDQTQREPKQQATSNANNPAAMSGQLAPGELTIMLMFPLNWQDLLGEKRPDNQKVESPVSNKKQQQKQKKCCCSPCWPFCKKQ